MNAKKRVAVGAALVLIIGTGALATVLYARNSSIDQAEAAACRIYGHDTDARIAACTVVINADPNAAWAYANIAAAALRRNDYGMALSNADTAIKLDPTLAAGYAMRAIANQSDPSKSYADAQKAIKLIDNRPGGMSEHGEVYLAVAIATAAVAQKSGTDLSETDDTVKTAKAAVEANELSVENHAHYADVLIEREMYGEAGKQLETAIEMDPSYAKSYVLRARISTRWKGYEDKVPLDIAASNAIEDLTKAITLEPYLAEAYVDRGMTYGMLKEDYPHAVDDYAKYLELKPADGFVRDMRVVYLIDAGRLDEALAEANRLVSESPNSSTKTHTTRAKVYSAMGRKNDAMADLRLVFNSDPNYGPAKKVLADLQRKK